MRLHKLQPRIGKARQRLVAHGTQHVPYRDGNRSCQPPGTNPGIDRPGGELALQHRRSVEKDSRCLHMAGHHLGGIFPEIQVVRPGIGHGHQQRIARAAAGSAGTLDIIGLRRRYRTLQHGGQVTDIDPHLQRGRGRQHVDVARRIVVGTEVLFHPLTCLAVEQAGVLMGHHALDIGRQVQLALGGITALSCSTCRMQGTPGNGHAQAKGLRLQPPDAGSRLPWPGRGAGQNTIIQALGTCDACRFQCLHGQSHQRLDHQHIVTQHQGVVQRGKARIDQLALPAQVAAQQGRAVAPVQVVMKRHEARATACPEQLPLDHILAVPIGTVTRAGIVQQVAVPPGATTAQRVDQPPQQLFQCHRHRVPFGLRRAVHLAVAHHVAQGCNLLGGAFSQPVHRLTQQVFIGLDPGGARGFEAAADAGLLAKFRADEPGQNPAKIAIQSAVRRQCPFAEQSGEIVQPVQLRWQETGQVTPLRQRAASHRKKQLRTQLARCRRIGQAADQRRLFHRPGHRLLCRQGLLPADSAERGSKRDGILQPIGLERTG